MKKQRPRTSRKHKGRIALASCLLILILSIVGYRVYTQTTESGVGIIDWTMGVIIMCATIGTSVVAVYYHHQLLPIMPLDRQNKIDKKAHQDLAKKYEHAKDTISDLDEKTEAWRWEERRLRNLYDETYEQHV